MDKKNLTTKDIPELTGLRGIAAAAILLNHVLLIAPDLRTTIFNRPLSMMGNLGVSLFFILSGTVIYYNYADKILINPAKEMSKFFLARFARLYPLYFLFIVIFFMVNTFLLGHSGDLLAADITSLPMFLFGLQDWVYGYINNFQVVHLQGSANIGWSISCEFALYLLFIPFVLLLKPQKSIKNVIIIFILSLFLRWIYLYFTYFDMSILNMWEDVYPGKSAQTRFYMIFYSPIGRFFEFMSGCAIAMLYSLNKPYSNYVKRMFSFVIIFCLLVLFLMSVKLINLPIDELTIISPILTLFILAISICGSRFLRSKLLILMGEISYSTYLLHIMIVEGIKHFDGDSSYKIGYIVLFFVLTYFISYFCYKYYEIPMKNKVKSFFSETKLGRN